MQEMQEQMNSMSDSREFQEVESNHSGTVSHVPSQPAPIPSSLSMLSCDKLLPLDTWNVSGPQENAFGNQLSAFDSSRNHYQRIHHSTTPGATGSVPVRIGAGTLVARDEDRIRGTIPNADMCKKVVDHEFIFASGDSADIHGWTAKTANIGTSIRQVPCTFYILMLEDKIQKPSDYLF